MTDGIIGSSFFVAQSTPHNLAEQPSEVFYVRRMDDLPSAHAIGIFSEIALSIGSECAMMIYEKFKGVQVFQ